MLLKKGLTYCFAFIWLINGLFCKVLSGVPRHQEIVERILGQEYGWVLVKLIGISEILMAIWILSGYKRRLNASMQILIIAVMNTIEFILVPDLLLWGKLNSVFAIILISSIYLWGFKLKTND